MKFRGPLVTLGAVAVLGAGVLLVNISKEPDPTTPGKAVAASATTAAAAPAPQPPAPVKPPPPAFPEKADYVGKIPTANRTITVEISVQNDKAVAYACDGSKVEAWLRGSAVNGVLSLASKDKTSMLDGHLEGSAVVGTLAIGQKKWDFTAPQVQSPAGLYVYQNAAARSSWIVDEKGGVTGVQRRDNGATSPAPQLTMRGTATVDGMEVRATRVQGDSDV